MKEILLFGDNIMNAIQQDTERIATRKAEVKDLDDSLQKLEEQQQALQEKIRQAERQLELDIRIRAAYLERCLELGLITQEECLALGLPTL